MIKQMAVSVAEGCLALWVPHDTRPGQAIMQEGLNMPLGAITLRRQGSSQAIAGNPPAMVTVHFRELPETGLCPGTGYQRLPNVDMALHGNQVAAQPDIHYLQASAHTDIRHFLLVSP